MQDILLIDKPKGITSFDCIRILRKKLNIRKMGHAGTLDPMATGLMIIGVGEGTKKLHEFLKLDKTYEAEILLGVKTDTGDITGSATHSMHSMGIFKQDCLKMPIEQTLQEMVGKLELPVPAYSAIKRGGEALYKKARRGETVHTPIKTMEVKSVIFLGLGDLALIHGRGFVLNEGIIVKARFDVGSGTYIRSLAEEFGRRLGVPATLAGLRRIRIGEFTLLNAQTLNDEAQPQP